MERQPGTPIHPDVSDLRPRPPHHQMTEHIPYRPEGGTIVRLIRKFTTNRKKRFQR